MAPHARSLIRFSFFIEDYGAPPLARARVKRRPMPAPIRAVSPVFRAFSHPDSLKTGTRLCRPALRAALRGAGDPPPLRSPWRLLPPVSPTGRGAGARVAPAPKIQKE